MNVQRLSAALMPTAMAALACLPAVDVVYAPQIPLFLDLVADQRRPQMAVEQLVAFDSEVTDTYPNLGTQRFALKIGEHLRFLRLETESLGKFDVSISGAFFGQFDQENALDILAWDGWYSLGVSWQQDPRWTWRLQYRHLSSHIGDEMVESTGRMRRGYTREDLVAEGLYRTQDWGMLYAGYGIKLHLGDAEGLEDIAFHIGWQTEERPFPLWQGWQWHAGVHLNWFEDNDYKTNASTRLALRLPTEHGESLVLFANAYTGRMIIGELSDLDESYISIGAGWDF